MTTTINDMPTFHRESSLVTYSSLPQILRKKVSLSLGTPGTVEFDFLEVWEFFKKVKTHDDYEFSNWQFFHVHPPGLNCASGLDIECAKGLALAFGHPLYFSIVTFGANAEERTVTSFVASPSGLEQLSPTSNINYLKASYLSKSEAEDLYWMSYTSGEDLCQK